MMDDSRTTIGSPANISDDSPVPNASWTDEQPSTIVIETIAEICDTDPLEMPPLYNAIDPEALDKLLISAAEAGDQAIELSFAYNGFTVVLLSNGLVYVEE